jgi:hypothetical protein
MTDDDRRRWKERYRNASVENLQASLANASPEHRSLISELIDEIRRAADAPHQRRHRELIWCTLIAAIIGALIGAAATAWFSSRGPANDRLQPAPLAVATPSPTLKESVPLPSDSPVGTSPAGILEGQGPTAEESPPTEEPPALEESAPTEEPPAPEESLPTPTPQEP